MFKKSRLLIGSVLALSLTQVTGCGGSGGPGESNDYVSSEEITVSLVNSLLTNEYTIFHKEDDAGFTCDGGVISGCYVGPECHESSNYYSTRTVYGVGDNTIKAYVIDYDTPDCKGPAGIHPSSAGLWQYTVAENNDVTGEVKIDLLSYYYSDGFVFDNEKPTAGSSAKAIVWINTTSEPNELCMSQDAIDPQRPLSLEHVDSYVDVDTANCVTQIF